MADKKKKTFTTKEPTTPRRPVILKSEREISKEPVKEKEKEKQPTIILKTREQSNPKDDILQSPKTSKVPTAETEGPQPSKIAQNENKEKKHADQKVSPPFKTMLEPVKLLDKHFVFNTAAMEFLHDSNTNYLIVGIIGNQGVGKSTILNMLAQNKFDQNMCSTILNSHEPSESIHDQNISNIEYQIKHLEIIDSSPTLTKTEKNIFSKFKMQDIEQIEKGIHCTKGIDMYVTSDRVILLDCQPLWSPSLIEDTLPPVKLKNSNEITVECLQIASFLMAISHVLIAVQDWFTDYNFLRYIQTAEMLKPSFSTSNSISNQEGSESNTVENLPHLLLLHNRCQLEDFTPESIKNMQDMYRNAFQRSSLQLNSGMFMYSDTNKNGLNVDSVCKSYNVETCGTPINMFLLPEIYEDYDNKDIYRGHPPFEQLAKRLRWMVLGVNRHQITNIPNLSEKGWLQYCNKAWETIKKCTFFMEYERFLPY